MVPLLADPERYEETVRRRIGLSWRIIYSRNSHRMQPE